MIVSHILKTISKLKILVIGDIILDHYIWGNVERISPEAPIPVIQITHETDVLGGAANVALNIAHLGAKVSLVGSIGKDDAGERLQKLLEEKEIRHDWVQSLPATPTNIKTRVIAQRQQVCRLDYEAQPSAYALNETSFLQALESNLADYQAILVSDYAKGVLHSSFLQNLINLAHTHHKLLTLDPKPSRKLIFQGAHLLTPNQAESYQLAGIEPLSYETYPAESICKRIQERYKPANLIITLGSEGMLLCKNGEILKHIPTYAKAVFDVSGAGDTVIACLTLALAGGASLEDAAHFANIAAGIVVSKVGTATASPEEILQYELSLGSKH